MGFYPQQEKTMVAYVHDPYSCHGMTQILVPKVQGPPPFGLVVPEPVSENTVNDETSSSANSQNQGDFNFLVGSKLRRRQFKCGPCLHNTARRLRYRRNIGTYVCDTCQLKWRLREGIVLCVDHSEYNGVYDAIAQFIEEDFDLFEMNDM